MNYNLRCFLSASYETDTTLIKNLLAENGVEVFDLYDFSIGESIQQILKRKLRQSDFALFILSEDNKNVLYEMGVCEGLGKQHFIFLEKNFKVPFYIENKLFLRVNLQDRDFLKLSIEKILQDVRKKRIKPTKRIKEDSKKSEKYNRDITDNLRSYLSQIRNLRELGYGKEIEFIVEKIFKTIKLNYVENPTNQGKGVDFALWNDDLGKIIGNPIIVEVKYGNLTESTFRLAEEQIKRYIDKTDAKIALLLYLDKRDKRHKIKSPLSPLILSYDLEDFTNELINSSFESIILNQRNKMNCAVTNLDLINKIFSNNQSFFRLICF